MVKVDHDLEKDGCMKMDSDSVASSRHFLSPPPPWRLGLAGTPMLLGFVSLLLPGGLIFEPSGSPATVDPSPA